MSTTSAQLRIGLNLPSRSAPNPLEPGELLGLSELIDSVDGWDTLWVGDSILALPYLDSTVLLGALAGRTRRVRLGVACLASLGFRHPIKVLREWADLDHLSAGRMTMVVCPGNGSGTAVEQELRTFATTYADKVERFEDAVRFLRVATTAGPGGAISYRSDLLDVQDLVLRPGFVQARLPIWMAANPSPTAGPKTLARLLGRVATLADGWMTYNVTPELLAVRVRQLHELLAEVGRGDEAASFPVCVFLNGNIATGTRTALSDAAVRWAQQGTRSIAVEDLVTIGAIGSPAQAADFLGRLRAAGATHVAIEPLSADPVRQVATMSELLLPTLA